MNDWIQSVLSSNQAGIVVLAALFLLGILSVFSCACNFAIIGAVTGYTGSLGSTGKKKTVIVCSLFFLLGTVVALSAIGGIVGYASEFISASVGSYWKVGTGIILILFGVYMLDMLPFKIGGISFNSLNIKSGTFGAVLFGFVLGGLAALSSICCNPVFPVIVAATLVKGSAFWGFFLLFVYALGFGATLAIAMLGIGLGIGKVSKLLSKFAVVMKYVGGITLIIVGFYLIITL